MSELSTGRVITTLSPEYDRYRTLDLSCVPTVVGEALADKMELAIKSLAPPRFDTIANPVTKDLRVAEVDPKSLFDQYLSLSGEARAAFLRMVASVSTAETPLFMIGHMGVLEGKRFSDLCEGEMIKRIAPVLLKYAIDAACQIPNGSREQIAEQTMILFTKEMDGFKKSISDVALATLKRSRDRKPSPDVIRRNTEICDFRKQDIKKWTHGRLAGKYGVTPQLIRKVLGEETKWRKLFAELSTK